MTQRSSRVRTMSVDRENPSLVIADRNGSLTPFHVPQGPRRQIGQRCDSNKRHTESKL